MTVTRRSSGNNGGVPHHSPRADTPRPATARRRHPPRSLPARFAAGLRQALCVLVSDLSSRPLRSQPAARFGAAGWDRSHWDRSHRTAPGLGREGPPDWTATGGRHDRNPSNAKACARARPQPPPSGLPPWQGWFEVHRPVFAARAVLGRETPHFAGGGRATRLCARARSGGRRKGALPRPPRPIALPRRPSSPQAQMLQDGVGDLGRGGRSAQVRCAGAAERAIRHSRQNR